MNNISGFSESKKLALIVKDKDDAITIDTNIDVNSAIKKWADKRYTEKTDDDKKKKFIELSLKLIARLKNESKE